MNARDWRDEISFVPESIPGMADHHDIDGEEVLAGGAVCRAQFGSTICIRLHIIQRPLRHEVIEKSIVVESQRIFRLVQASPGHCSEPRSWLIDMRRIEGVHRMPLGRRNVVEAWVRQISGPET